MQSLKILLAVLAIVDIAVNKALADNFIKRALENLKRHQEDRYISVDKYQEQRDDDDDDDDDDNTRSASPRGLGELLELALKANENNRGQSRVNRKETNRKNKRNQPTYFDVLSGLGLNDIAVYDPESDTPIRTEKEMNPLMALLESSNYDKVIAEDENNKSPIYLVVKSDDRQSSISDKSIKDLFSSLLKSSISQNDRSNGRPEHRYKGFRVQNARRADLIDKFSSGENDDKRPMVISRPRTYGGGRTPIPYIKHRGDIYEKDS